MFVCETMKETGTVMGYKGYGCNLNASANEKKKILECSLLLYGLDNFKISA